MICSLNYIFGADEITGHHIHWFIFYQKGHIILFKKGCVYMCLLCPSLHFWLKYPYPPMSFAHRRPQGHTGVLCACDCLWTLQPSRGRINAQTLWSPSTWNFVGVPLKVLRILLGSTRTSQKHSGRGEQGRSKEWWEW